MNHFLRGLLMIASLGMTGCRCGSDGTSGGTHETAQAKGPTIKELPRKESLYIGGIQWGEPTSFNPLNDSAAAWPCRLPNKLIYETLLEYNTQTGQMEPLLAESFQVTDQGIDVTLFKDARWNDGRPVSAWDVKFTYDLGRTNQSAPISQVWDYLGEVRVTDAPSDKAPRPEAETPEDRPRRIHFAYKPGNKNPLKLLVSLQQDFILPRHVYETALERAGGDFQKLIAQKFDRDPVASGPYRLHSYSAEKIVTARDDAYWGNKVLHGGETPVPKYVIHQIYNSNDQYSVALQQGRLDIASAFIPRIWLKEKKQVYPWLKKAPFYEGTAIPMLFINVTKGALGDVKLRRAMAHAINYADIRELAVSGYSSELMSGAILPSGIESRYFSGEDAARLGASTYDPAKAKALLAEAGYHSQFDAKGQLQEMRDRTGAKVPTIEITSPAGWTDWESIVKVVVKSFRAVGIDARERFVDGNLFWALQPKGEFDLLMWTPVTESSPAQPWARFEFMLSTAGMAPVGEKMWRNYGRFNDPKSPHYVRRFDELLKAIPTMTDEGQLIAAYRELNALFMEYQPTLPLVYRPEQFYQYSTKTWANFPSGDNAYGPPFLAGYRGGTKMLWQIRSAVSS